MTRSLFVSRHQLTECPECHAHFRLTEEPARARCDFCGASATAAPRDVFALLRDLGSSTTGGIVTAALLGMGLVHCSDPVVASPDAAPARDAAPIVPLYGIPPTDSGATEADSGGATADASAQPDAAAAADAMAQTDSGAAAADATPVPLYGIAPADASADADAVASDADSVPVPLYGIAPADASATVDASPADADSVPVPLYGIAPADSGIKDATPGDVDSVPVPLYGIAPADSGASNAPLDHDGEILA